MALFNFLEQVDMAIQPKRWRPLSRHPILQFGRMKARSESAENRVQRNRRNRRNRRKEGTDSISKVLSPLWQVLSHEYQVSQTRLLSHGGTEVQVWSPWLREILQEEGGFAGPSGGSPCGEAFSVCGPAPAVGRPSRGNAIWWTMWSLLTMASPVRPAVFAFARSPSLRTTGSWCTPML